MFKVGDKVTIKSKGPFTQLDAKCVKGLSGIIVSVLNRESHMKSLRYDYLVVFPEFKDSAGCPITEWYVSHADIDGFTPEKADKTNPKDLIGSKKISITKFPAAAIIHGAHAMMNGASKYGPYNWRSNDVIASIYVDAAFRHLFAWFEREETAEDSGVHHLGHALATIGILLDAQENGNLIDDRPKQDKEVIKNLLDRLAEAIKKNKEEKK